jgi:hypothetical protein
MDPFLELLDFFLAYGGDSSKLRCDDWLFPLLLLSESELWLRNFKNSFYYIVILFLWHSITSFVFPWHWNINLSS